MEKELHRETKVLTKLFICVSGCKGCLSLACQHIQLITAAESKCSCGISMLGWGEWKERWLKHYQTYCYLQRDLSMYLKQETIIKQKRTSWNLWRCPWCWSFCFCSPSVTHHYNIFQLYIYFLFVSKRISCKMKLVFFYSHIYLFIFTSL